LTAGGQSPPGFGQACFGDIIGLLIRLFSAVSLDIVFDHTQKSQRHR
jgi:hypothetical protein